MRARIVADSCCDMTPEMKEEMEIETVPLTLRLEDKEYVDDEKLDIKSYVMDMRECKTPPKTSCPSPADFINKFKGEGSVFAVTLSSKLSGTYQSAVIAKNMLSEQMSEKFIHVFDSLSASIGETLICKKINELLRDNIDETEIVEKVTKYIGSMKTFFLLENIEHLAKSGRLNPIIAKVASILDIKPILGSDGEGNIKLFRKIRGYKRAFTKFIDLIEEEAINPEDKILGIAHCNCLERAQKFKAEVLKRYKFKSIIIAEMSGTISSYADDGGLLIAF